MKQLNSKYMTMVVIYSMILLSGCSTVGSTQTSSSTFSSFPPAQALGKPAASYPR